jgi:ElaB/YqjD/DUF883 family membrane-anchored ribosome-binding protein
MKATDVSKSTANGAALYPSSLVDGAASSAHSAVDRIAGAVPDIIDSVAAGAHSSVDRAAKSLQPAAKRIGKVAQQLNRTGNNALVGTRQYVSEHPFLTIASALALGMLISSFTRSRD